MRRDDHMDAVPVPAPGDEDPRERVVGNFVGDDRLRTALDVHVADEGVGGGGRIVGDGEGRSPDRWAALRGADEPDRLAEGAGEEKLTVCVETQDRGLSPNGDRPLMKNDVALIDVAVDDRLAVLPKTRERHGVRTDAYRKGGGRRRHGRGGGLDLGVPGGRRMSRECDGQGERESGEPG